MTRCAAVYVELGERPELDQLRRCTSDLWQCRDHEVQLDWVRADPARLAAYNQQLRRYDLGQRIGAQATQGALL
jgi:hypothetical protein